MPGKFRRFSQSAAPSFPRPDRPTLLDRHVLYEAAVQDVGFELEFVRRVFTRLRGRSLRRLREDFCGTAALASAWVAGDRSRRAWGVERDPKTLGWCRRHRLPILGSAGNRMTLVNADVRKINRPGVDVVAALNYSYWTFRRRRDLLEYFRAVRRSLTSDGLLVLDLYGGSGASRIVQEHSVIRGARDAWGRVIPTFTYIWEQRRFNPVDQRLSCHIHFERLPGGRAMRSAFSYDWRLWTIPEIREVLEEAGFSATHIYLQGWDEARKKPYHVFRERKRFDNQEDWLAYVVAER